MRLTEKDAAAFLLELANRAQAHWPEGVVLEVSERVKLREIAGLFRGGKAAPSGDRMFTIMGFAPIPWSVIAPHEARAQSNHSQSLERLNQRGGLSPAEALCVLLDVSLYTHPKADALLKVSEEAADLELRALVAQRIGSPAGASR